MAGRRPVEAHLDKVHIHRGQGLGEGAFKIAVAGGAVSFRKAGRFCTLAEFVPKLSPPYTREGIPDNNVEPYRMGVQTDGTVAGIEWGHEPRKVLEQVAWRTQTRTLYEGPIYGLVVPACYLVIAEVLSKVVDGG